MSAYPYQKQINTTSNLESLLERNPSLKLIRPFKGMLFTQELSFVSIEEDQAHFAISRGRLLANPGDRIFLRSSSGMEVFSALVLELDNYLGRLVLSEFKPIGRSWAARSHERVQPHQPTRVMLHCKDCLLPTFLENFSLAGIGLLAYKPVERGLELRIGHMVKVDFDLPLVRGHISLPGKLVNVSHPGERLAYLGVQIFPNMQQSRLMERYITNRKSEIIDEMDKVIHASFVPPSVQDMYF
jgi:hypothetical protein